MGDGAYGYLEEAGSKQRVSKCETGVLLGFFVCLVGFGFLFCLFVIHSRDTNPLSKV